ncbi:hypothetical protein [Burkholderia pseudomallei]|uniref:hypothetical protein n=1 Tax=Burkholderia pseudomallei TaxID=28450 RepID=UPI000536EBF2|nr:hypothetical protein [Burkholderia pseudomallei]KGX39753.1 hypothetical protein Y043_2831 [Burkholderia pseudomallei MSHR2138]KGX47849.1 hypothetical protein Y600_5979 [Burkholderia pseudomallei MSHR3709]
MALPVLVRRPTSQNYYFRRAVPPHLRASLELLAVMRGHALRGVAENPINLVLAQVAPAVWRSRVRSERKISRLPESALLQREGDSMAKYRVEALNLSHLYGSY